MSLQIIYSAEDRNSELSDAIRKAWKAKTIAAKQAAAKRVAHILLHAEGSENIGPWSKHDFEVFQNAYDDEMADVHDSTLEEDKIAVWVWNAAYIILRDKTAKKIPPAYAEIKKSFLREGDGAYALLKAKDMDGYENAVEDMTMGDEYGDGAKSDDVKAKWDSIARYRHGVLRDQDFTSKKRQQMFSRFLRDLRTADKKAAGMPVSDADASPKPSVKRIPSVPKPSGSREYPVDQTGRPRAYFDSKENAERQRQVVAAQKKRFAEQKMRLAEETRIRQAEETRVRQAEETRIRQAEETRIRQDYARRRAQLNAEEKQALAAVRAL